MNYMGVVFIGLLTVAFFLGKTLGIAKLKEQALADQQQYAKQIDILQKDVNADYDKLLQLQAQLHTIEKIKVVHNCDNKVMQDTLNQFIATETHYIVESHL